jgi:hypothetical protein
MVRPNILMFNDEDWNCDRTQQQTDRFQKWLKEVQEEPLTIIEIGAGENVATIRRLSERVLTRQTDSKAVTSLLRINPFD